MSSLGFENWYVCKYSLLSSRQNIRKQRENTVLSGRETWLQNPVSTLSPIFLRELFLAGEKRKFAPRPTKISRSFDINRVRA